MVPYREQQRKMKAGEKHLVYLYLDEDTNRLAATSKIDRFIEQDDLTVQVGDKVSAKETLGKIRTDPDGQTVLKFLVSQNSVYFNPTSWLSGR